jgi:hypothetical protein
VNTPHEYPALGLYQHYKGGFYQLIGVANDSETEEPFAVYRALYGDFGLWLRPLAVFTANLADGRPRFAFVRPL